MHWHIKSITLASLHMYNKHVITYMSMLKKSWTVIFSMYDTVSLHWSYKKSTIHVGKDTIPIDPSSVHIILDFLKYIRCLEKIQNTPPMVVLHGDESHGRICKKSPQVNKQKFAIPIQFYHYVKTNWFEQQKLKKKYSPKNPYGPYQGGPWTCMKRRGVFGTSRVLQGAMCWASDGHVERSQIHNVETWRMFFKAPIPGSSKRCWMDDVWGPYTPSLKQHPLEDAGVYIYIQDYIIGILTKRFL